MDSQNLQLEWNEDLSCGINEIDEQHRHFIFLIRHLIRSIVERMETDEVRCRMQMLLDNGMLHFASEEKVLGERNYPDAVHHVGEHQMVLRRIRKIMADIGPHSTQQQCSEAARNINTILIHHLLNQDREYRDYFRSSSG